MRAFVAAQDESLDAQVRAVNLEVSGWMARMESDFSERVGLGEVLGTRCNLLIQGLLLAHQVANVCKLHVGMHMHTRLPIRQRNLPALLQAILLLKAISHTYFRKSAQIGAHMLHIHRFVQTRLLAIVEPIASDLEGQVATARKGGFKVDEAKANMSAVATVLADALKGPNARKRRAVAQVAWDMLPKKQIRQGDVDEVNLQLRKLELLGSLQPLLGAACDCSFLLSSRGLLPLFFAGMQQHWPRAFQLPYLLAAVGDAGDVVAAAQDAGAVHTRALEELRAFVFGALEDEVVAPLCQQVETDLRLHIHSVQTADASALSPAEVAPNNVMREEVADVKCVLALPPLLLLGTLIDIRELVARYLDRTFYNLTTVTPKDWRTYEEMRALAQDKYGLSLIDTYLPTGSVEEGIDVLEIMRNIHVFVGRYHYHLHTQVFTQRPGGSKYISTIGIQQVAHSIRTHGTGMLNTTVNYSYQFLARKLAILSQFLYDDHIRSRLLRDVNFFKKERASLNNRYPYDRAHEFHTEIRRLGVDDQGLSYLDKFRQLVIEIGNALGYVRMLRAGALNYISSSVSYIPDIHAVDKVRNAAAAAAAAGEGGAQAGGGGFREFSEAVQGEAGLSAATRAAATNVDGVIEELSGKFERGTDFLRLLVDVFAPQVSVTLSLLGWLVFCACRWWAGVRGCARVHAV